MTEGPFMPLKNSGHERSNIKMPQNQLAPSELQEWEDSLKDLKVKPNISALKELEQAIQEDFLEGENPRKPLYLSPNDLPTDTIN